MKAWQVQYVPSTSNFKDAVLSYASLEETRELRRRFLDCETKFDDAETDLYRRIGSYEGFGQRDASP